MISEEKRNSAMDTLYVSDLDGTLMKNDETISEYTVRTINELIEKELHLPMLLPDR